MFDMSQETAPAEWTHGPLPDKVQAGTGTVIIGAYNITDAGYRDRMYVRAVGRWIERDAAAAGAWMQSNALPPSVQEQLQRQLSAPQP